jgi:hypothetical protein
VHYRVGDDALVLRTSHDWETDVAPVEVSANGAVFDLDLAEPWVALKPCLRRAGKHHWSVGNNYILSAHSGQAGAVTIYGTHGSVNPPRECR